MSATKNAAGLWEIQIDDKSYEFQKWGAEDSVDCLLDLAAVAGKPLGLLAQTFLGKDDAGKSGLDKTLPEGAIPALMESFTGQVGANKLMVKALIKKLSSDKVFCNGAPIKFDSHFQDSLDHLFKVVRAALEVQYGNFFGAILGASGFKPTVQGLVNRNPQT